jgi:signal transduction histidine kinase
MGYGRQQVTTVAGVRAGDHSQLHQLVQEQAALRRVATLVARGGRPETLFAVVAEQVAHVLQVPLVDIVRYERDGTASERASFSPGGPMFAVGRRWSLGGTNVIAQVRESCRPARIDDYTGLTGEIAETLRGVGIRSRVGVPIIVSGSLWGAMVVSSRELDPLPPDTEARLSDFTELVATAIANGEASEQLERLALEQAALRRVATLVAEGAAPTAVFDAVVAEMERLLKADGVILGRYESGDELTLLARCGVSTSMVPRGARVSHEGEYVATMVRRSEQPARIELDAATHGAVAPRPGMRASVGTPIVVEGRLWGVISAGWNTDETPPADTEQRMAQFAQLLDTAVANADSRDQLTASRARLLTAGYDARRRVVRDLHDGAQQRLVHTVLTLKLAKRALASGNGRAESLLDDALAYAEQANHELHELAHGILPSVLTIGGLSAGVRELVERLELAVELDVATERFPADVEATAYFIVAEALTNVLKHSHAEHARVSVSAEDRVLWLEVCDDGIGGADPAGDGLLGLDDRATALGGRLTVENPPGGGTRLTATLPLD